MLWMDENASQQSNEKSLMMENLQLISETTTKLARTASTWGRGCRCAQQVKYAGNTDVFCFGFNFMSPKWTRTKLMIEISPSLQAY